MSDTHNANAAFEPLTGEELIQKGPQERQSGGASLIMPVPERGPPVPDYHPHLGRPSQIWTFHSAAGLVLYYVFRFETSQGKEIRPLTLWHKPSGQLGWDWKAPPGKRPLYGLDRLAARPFAPVLVVEGEKAADAAHRLCPDMVVVTSSGGANAAGSADWRPLAGREILIWPDNDPAGQHYAQTVATILVNLRVTRLRLVDAGQLAALMPEGQRREPVVGWDAADAALDGWTSEKLSAVLNDLTEPWAQPEADEVDPLDGITSDPALKAAIRRLVGFKAGDYALKRKAEAQTLGISVSSLDRFVQIARGEEPDRGERAQRDTLLELAQDAELWRDPAGDAYATVDEVGARKTYRVRSGDFRGWLIRCWMDQFGDGGLISAPGNQGLQDAIAAIEAKAQQGPVHTAFVRIGHQEDRVYVDLGDETWRAVEIDTDGWRIINDVPVRFVRPSGMLPLPEPVHDPDGLKALHAILPDGADAKDAKLLLLSFLVGVFMPQGSLPLLALSGRQGSGKSTLTRRLRALVDPNQAPARQQPRSEDDLIIAARNGALVAFDNLSRIDAELSDALCRLATGAGFSKRRLYTDADEIIVQVRRPVIVNGITDLVRMPDLADRALFVELPTRASYAPEAELESSFARDRPAMLAVLYDAVSSALRGYATEKGSAGVRLADFERWVRAAGPALGLEPEEVSGTLGENRVTADRMLIDDDIVASLVMKMLDTCTSLSGTATELLRQFREQADEGDERHLPKGPRALSAHLRRFVPAFERCGISMEQSRTGNDRQRVWTIRRKSARTTTEWF